MAWDDAAKKLAIKVIGTVESNMKYDSIYYVDAITVGIMQWYGTRAANILNEMRATPAWVGVAPSLTSDLATVSETNSSFWTSRYLTRAEGTSLKGVLTSATGVQIQHAKTLSDLDEYKYQASRVGIDADTETQQFIYFCVMYHQSPKFARQVVNETRANPTLDRLHTLTLNHSWFSKFKNRYNQARTMILAGDTSGIPDFGTETGTTPTTPEEDDENEPDWDHGGPSSPTQATGSIIDVTLVGQQVHVRTKDGVVICQPTNTNTRWVPGSLEQPDAGPVIVPPTPANPDPDEPPAPNPEPTPPGSPGKKYVYVTANPTKIATYKGRKFTNLMLDCVRSWEAACVAEGIPFVIVQGGWNPGGVSASAGTHDKDGGDLRSRTMNKEQVTKCIELGRERGLCASFRTNGAKYGVRAQGFKSGEHIHFVPNKWGTPSPPADRQATQYRNGTDGLKGARPDVGPGHVSTYRERTWPEFVSLYG